MVALVKWVLYNQYGEAVCTFTPIAIVPVGRSSDPLAICSLYLDAVSSNERDGQSGLTMVVIQLLDPLEM